jgi:hypothetical protein
LRKRGAASPRDIQLERALGRAVAHEVVVEVHAAAVVARRDPATDLTAALLEVERLAGQIVVEVVAQRPATTMGHALSRIPKLPGMASL